MSISIHQSIQLLLLLLQNLFTEFLFVLCCCILHLVQLGLKVFFFFLQLNYLFLCLFVLLGDNFDLIRQLFNFILFFIYLFLIILKLIVNACSQSLCLSVILRVFLLIFLLPIFLYQECHPPFKLLLYTIGIVQLLLGNAKLAFHLS